MNKRIKDASAFTERLKAMPAQDAVLLTMEVMICKKHGKENKLALFKNEDFLVWSEQNRDVIVQIYNYVLDRNEEEQTQ